MEWRTHSMDEQFLSSEELRELTKDFSDPEKVKFQVRKSTL